MAIGRFQRDSRTRSPRPKGNKNCSARTLHPRPSTTRFRFATTGSQAIVQGSRYEHSADVVESSCSTTLLHLVGRPWCDRPTSPTRPIPTLASHSSPKQPSRVIARRQPEPTHRRRCRQSRSRIRSSDRMSSATSLSPHKGTTCRRTRSMIRIWPWSISSVMDCPMWWSRGRSDSAIGGTWAVDGSTTLDRWRTCLRRSPWSNQAWDSATSEATVERICSCMTDRCLGSTRRP